MPSDLFEYDDHVVTVCKRCGAGINKGDVAATAGFGLYYLCADCATADDTEVVNGTGWLVETPDHMTDLVFPDDEYDGAFQHATGDRVENFEERDCVDYPGEQRITSIDFGKPTEVPIADV